MKRIVAVCAILSLLLVGAPSLAATLSGTFTDDDGNIHEPNIQAIAAEGITFGCGGARYCPGHTVRRDEMASFLARALGLAPITDGPFDDIAGDPHAGNINAIAASGITLGCAATSYCPAAPVRRDEMATFLARALGLADAPSPFLDTTNNPHEGAIGAIAAAGITLGCATGRYCPDEVVHRDEMASFLARALGLAPRYVELTLGAGIPLSCRKDRLVCTGRLDLPYRAAYDVSEGFYNLLPFRGNEQSEFQSSSTRFELTVDGVAQTLTPTVGDLTGTTAEKRFDGQITLAPGAHQVIGQWFWNSRLVKTTIIDITVAS